MGRILSLDLGAKRVGVAVSDPLKLIAQPLVTLPFRSFDALFKDVQALVAEREIELVVIGLPLCGDGREGPLAVLARRFKDRLAGAHIPAALQDESFSSREAEDVLHEHGKHRRPHREKIDQIAAAIILQEYLAARGGERRPGRP